MQYDLGGQFAVCECRVCVPCSAPHPVTRNKELRLIFVIINSSSVVAVVPKLQYVQNIYWEHLLGGGVKDLDMS